MRPLNFASEPFRNERLPATLFAAASVVLVAVTIQHALVLRALLPARTSKLHQEVTALEAEAERLRAEARSMTAPKPDKLVIAEWNVLKDLVDRRTFSWTGLFACLEQVLPRQVRLVSIAPDVAHGQVILDLVAVAQPSQAGLGLVGLLEQRAEFEDVYPLRVTEKEGGAAEFNYKMRYLPGANTAEAAVAAPTEPEPEPERVPQPTASAAPPPSGAPGARMPAPAAPAPAAQPLKREPREPRARPPVEEAPSETDPPPPEKPDPDTDVRTLSRTPREREH